MIEYLQNHDYKVFTNEAYNTFVSQSKSVKKEIYPSPPSFYASPAPPKLSYKPVSVQSGSTYIPKLSIFSGDPSRSDVSYDVWKYEVECLINEEYSEKVIFQAIRRSLKGQASKSAMRLGPDAALDEILEKMESIHGTVEREESLITNFYSALQKGDDNTTAWGCRIEDLLSKAVSIGKIHHDDVDEMLKYKFWTGLRQDLKDTTGYLYDKCTTFDKLRKEIRLVELEHPVNKKSTPSMNVAASGKFTP